MNMSTLFAPMLAAFAFTIAAPEAVQAKHHAAVEQSDEAKIETWAEKWKAAFQAGDVEQLRDMYESDAVLMANGAVPAKGREAILEFLGRNKAAGNAVTIDFQNEELKFDGDRAYLTAKYWMTITLQTGKALDFMGRSFLVFKKNKGHNGHAEWRLWRDIDNLAPDVRAEDRPER